MKSVLADFQTLPLKDASRQLPAKLGYQSARSFPSILSNAPA